MAYLLGALTVVVVFAAVAGALFLLGRLENHRIAKAQGSDSYLRAGLVQVLPGSPVARSGR